MIKKLLPVLLIAVMLSTGAQANMPLFGKKKETPKEAPKPAEPPKEKPDPKPYKPYKEVITKDAKTSVGFFKVHSVKDRYFFEIPDSLLGRDILVVNRISKAPADNNKSKVGYPGDEIGEEVIRFEKGGPKHKILMRNISYIEKSTDTLGMYQSVMNSNIQPIVAAFDIKAYDNDTASTTSIIDVTDYIKGDKGVFGFDERMRKGIGLANMMPEASYIDTLKAFPINIEIQTVKTFARAPAQGAEQMYGVATTPLTYEMNSSILLLPKEAMKPRFFDSRVAYFAVRYTDFDVNPQGVERRSIITRWRLEPKDEDMERYKRGELVEPKKPIVIYIDPATPKKWVPYLMAGVNDWKGAFEKAGFKNAIYALEAPDDPSWSLEDARHSAIVYKPSDIPNASGPHVHDPRSGEIMETHINWYHNVMQLLRNWYTIQTAAIDPRARTANLDDELMGQLIRFVSSHEVGHTLGLRHNFGSSATVPVEKLRDKAWVEANGHTPSIMDYARFNYVAQPEDGITEKGIFPRIGIYDEWSIEWGYRVLPEFKTAEDELHFSNQSIIAKLKEDKRYEFGTETDPFDPRNQNEDLGDNAMLASTYGIKNLQRIVPEIIKWTSEPDKGYNKASSLHSDLVGQFARYMGHVTTNIGGIYTTPKTVEQEGALQEFVPAKTQKEAIAFLDKQLFTTPLWLFNNDLTTKALADPLASIGSIQSRIISRIISKGTIDRLSRYELQSAAAAYTPANMFSDLKRSIWSELQNGKTPDIYRRNLQKEYVQALIRLLDKPAATPAAMTNSSNPSDASAIARGQLTELLQQIKSTASASAGIKKYHYQNLAAIIDVALDPK